MAYELELDRDKVEQIKTIARDRGMSEDDVVAEMVQLFLCKTGQVTRFAAKKGPKKQEVLV